MKSENPILPPKKKKNKREHPEAKDPRAKEKEKETRPAAAENTRGVIPPAGSEEAPSSEDANGNWKKPITNQDAQEKITNQGTDDTIPVE